MSCIKRGLGRAVLSLGLLLGMLQPLTAQSDQAKPGFDPREKCGDVLSRSGDLEKVMVAAWTYGYLAAAQDKAGLVDLDNIRVMVRNLTKACAGKDQMTLLALVQGSRSAPASQSGSEANARLMLEKFLQPGADIAALTAALIPDEADIRAVYRDPLAAKELVDVIEQFVDFVLPVRAFRMEVLNCLLNRFGECLQDYLGQNGPGTWQ